VVSEVPTITEPSSETLSEELIVPPSVPMSRIPPAAVQRKARQKSLLSRAWPTTTAPLADASSPRLSVPVVTPRSWRPPPAVRTRRNACRRPLEVVDQPVTTLPSGETPRTEAQQPPSVGGGAWIPPDCVQTADTTGPSEDISSAS
jgi:hypothetical protein